jgi:hypothetical protein
MTMSLLQSYGCANTKFGVINIFSLTVPWTGMSIPDQMLEDTGSFEDGRRL